ncbi:MAG: RnfABCDGE type electron transport complex subunit B [Acidiferrobacterales bacterium]|nr:RnfABCDGE type electron transport complex subunit B [Acidiferrobacterales bacterium]
MTAISNSSLVAQIDALLPQTQCTQCDYPRCLDYAKAISNSEAKINQCPPGDDITIKALAELTGNRPLPLNPKNGEHEPRQVAKIEESACIGCKLCIKACPVDCIVGAGKVMHTILATECTGCKLCIPVCPTDCIELLPFGGKPFGQSSSRWPEYSQDQVDKARLRTELKIARMARKEGERKVQRTAKKRSALQEEIQAVLARKRDRS